jgi:predicted outer membrane protein
MSKPLVAVVVSSLMFGACAKKGPDSETAASVPPPPATQTTVEAVPPPAVEPAPAPVVEAPPPPPAPAPLTDAQIAKVLETVDTGEIAQAKLAQKKSKNPKVKQFAAHMIQAHTKSKTKGATLAKKAKLTPEETPVSQELAAKAAQHLATLEAADATTFDSTYISGQAQQHEEVLSLIQSQLEPGATDAGLKGLLGEVRTMVEEHVTKAKTLQETVSASAPSAAAPAAAPASGAGAMQNANSAAPATSAAPMAPAAPH